MISIDLDAVHQARLNSLAAAQGEDGPSLARRVLLDFLDFSALPADSEAAWAEASVALSPEVMDQESWDDADHES
jgi:hypothetical protein